jgi:predicted RND superfamily exporter protein
VNPLSRASLRRPFRTLGCVAALALAAAPGLVRLELRTDGAALIPRRSPAVVYDHAVRREMGLRDPVVAVVRTDHPDGIFNAGTLRRVRDLTASLDRLPGIGPANLTSLATEQGLRFRPGTLQRSPFLDPMPETPAALAELRSEIRRIGVYDRALISADGAGTAIVLGVPPEADRAAFYRRVREIATAQASPHDRIDVIGAPVAETLLGSHILADLGVPRSWLTDVEGTVEGTGRRIGLVPLSLAVMALVFLIGFQRPAAALLPLLKVGLCLEIVFGAMGWLGVPVYLTTAVLPVLLIAVGTASEVHLFRRYGELGRETPDRPRIERVRAAVEEVERPVLQAAATTAVGFLSFALSPLGPVQAFGFFAAGGVLLCLLGSFTATPAVLALLPAGWVVRRASPARSGGENAFSRVGRFAWRHRRAVLAASALVALLSLDGVRRVAVQDSWIDGFSPGSAFARQMRWFDRQFRGAHLLQVVVEAEPLLLAGKVDGGAVGDRELTLPLSLPPQQQRLDPARLPGSWIELRGRPALPWSSWIESARTEKGRMLLSWPLRGGSPKFWLMPRPRERVSYEIRLEPLMAPAALRRAEGLEAFLGGRPGVGGTFGPAEFLKTAAFLVNPAPGSRRLPEDPQAARILWNNSERVRGPERLRQMVNAGYSRGLVSVFLKDSNYAATGRLMSEVKAYERRFLAPHGVRLGFAGDVAVSQALIGAVVSTQVGSLGLSLLGIFAVTAGLSRSLMRGLLCVIPASFAVLLNFAAMGWLGIPLGVATSMFAGMTLGVGVDYAIHLLARFKAEGKDGEGALARALGETGPAILIDSGSSLLGFAVLLASQVPANHRLGGLLALSLIDCFAATLLVAPALLAGRRPTSPSSPA